MPFPIPLSAAALTTFERCPRQFQYLYLDRMGFASSSPEQAWGRQFHRLVELHTQGSPVEDRWSALDPQVQKWWRVFEASPHWEPDGEVRSELSLWAQIQGWRIVARLDRLVIPSSADLAPIQILDWKTSRYRPTQLELAQSWQVKLYPLLVWHLSEALVGSSISPEQIRLTFWYTHHPGSPHVIPYTQAQLEQDWAYLQQTLVKIEQAATQGFPMTPQGSICEQCPFRGVCFGLMPLPPSPETLTTPAGIPEADQDIDWDPEDDGTRS